MQIIQNRRTFLTGLSAAGVVSSFRLPQASATEPSPPETTTLRFADFPESTCTVPQFIATQLLLQDGFSEVVQVNTGDSGTSLRLFENNEIDFSFELASALAVGLENGTAMKAIAGIHVGCFLLFGREGIDSVVDLKGRKVAVGPTVGSDPQIYVSAMAAYVGLDPQTDIEWVYSEAPPAKLFEEGKVDALLSFPPEAQALRRRKIGQVIVNSMSDRPWSQYFCCMLLGNPAFTQNYPVATKRVVRAVLKAADICVSNPQQAVQLLLDREEIRSEQAEDTLTAIQEIPYGAWRVFDPEDTIRFFALRLHEAGMITTSPQKIIEEGTDWSFLNEVKRELKA